MTAILKQKMRELGRDESGVAFVFTVTVSLIVFLFGFAIYACGETVRQRIELQNAADAAAYSGALVQADTISRVAVINKAMAWNYVMMTRRQMDHIVGAWLGKVTERWRHDCTVTNAAQQTCSCHWRFEFWNWRVGVDPSGGAGEGIVHQLIRLNESKSVGIPEILGGIGEGAAQNPVSLLNSLRNCIVSMNQAEKELVSGMKTRIENAVEFAVNANVSLTENDKKVREKRKIQWTLYDLKDANRYFETLRSDESRFLGFGDFSGSAVETFGAGANTWLTLESAEGFQRNYQQTGNTLSARWFTYNQHWWHDETGCHYAGFSAHAVAPVTGEQGRDEYYTGEKACPMVLKSNFFKPDGAIVAGVSRPLNNPFAFLFGGGEKSGIYSAFCVGGGSQTMWSVSGARAGYRLPGWREGEYRNRGKIEDKDNLSVSDWDALFLPLRDNNSTVKSSFLEDLAKKLGASKSFVSKDYSSPYSKIEFSGAGKHLHH